ncbi:phosphoribosylamine--glycine ligase [Advenella alkanexedens]|jgi:phosphoribosylamine--glycine ligase|uniref:Phosphoribosylamine--glycine ligase n=1 Tax=Advenella alkanexedens TaxID=1481665 RepID=A0ABS6NJU0_9BURK|nr:MULTISPECIES: phosphoribosylamine--glycine ligase [Advenella]MBV4395900.1 phosphoribosylamine--glycine ligase [Advenella alkanexedens]MDD3757299.1 phosphoribosylamine--glycine ligase [Advenella sp.]NLN67853.1 phosphoribosylamine--glycine ligase [Alcaligenaceae bacterium]WKU18835.1 phosphoribosylamine--glycine ligase [Advenella alkanexedens]
MKVLVIGNGGREHAIAWRIAQSAQVSDVFVAPGNGGTALDPLLKNVAITNLDELAAFAKKEGIDLTVVGPEAPLAAGVVDLFREQGLAVFGPTKAAAQLESSKDFAKAFMVRHNIPTSAYATFTSPEQAHAYINEQGAPIVVKADGLAAGKGVVVAQTLQEAHDAVDAMLGDGSLGEAGARVVIEGFLTGEEASFIVMCDGKNILPMATSQDHKRQLDNDQGPNTGGMGAYSPAPIVSDRLHERIMQEVIYPTIQGMEKDGITFTGFLYAGLMIDDGNDEDRSIKVLEFNCRMGDPETQPIMMRLQGDYADTLLKAAQGKLDQASISWDPRTALGVVMASYNYPGTPRTGDVITGIPAPQENCVTFHAGSALKDNQLVTSGGRVLCVTALGDTVQQARETAYATVKQIKFDGQQYRSDIAWRALK